ncbi:hypothetical protein [Bacillus sp. ISL-47]|uniref:hypothetical protein n=1 Tax=Bacillus sp. ISL-47 TaxID=2819130 RepID=UPI001BE99048|nr:hypothetical protein [Bacillus sp. ISL-47]MBT2711233.1 hypothetical protein [Pseudomonas sp. ISL-84]
MENTFVYLVTLVININYTWIVYEELNMAKISEQALNNSAFLLHRSITLPLVVVITLNLYRTANGFGSKFVKTFLSVLFLVISIYIARYFEVVEYKKWKMIYEVIYLFLLHFVAYYSLKYFESLQTKEVKAS